MEFGVADAASLASPDLMSLAMNSVKIAVKVHGVYSARGGKLAEFASFMQTVAADVEAMAQRLQGGAVPALTKLNQTLERAATKVEKYKKRNTVEALCYARSENARIQQLKTEITSLLQQLKVSAYGQGASGMGAQGAATAAGAAAAAAGGFAHWQQMASPAASPGVAGMMQAAAQRQQQSHAALQQMMQAAAAQRQQSLDALSQLQGGAYQPSYQNPMAGLAQTMQAASLQQQQALAQLNQVTQAAAAQQQAALAGLTQQMQGYSSCNWSGSTAMQEALQAMAQQNVEAVAAGGGDAASHIAEMYNFSSGQ